MPQPPMEVDDLDGSARDVGFAFVVAAQSSVSSLV